MRCFILKDISNLLDIKFTMYSGSYGGSSVLLKNLFFSWGHISIEYTYNTIHFDEKEDIIDFVCNHINCDSCDCDYCDLTEDFFYYEDFLKNVYNKLYDFIQSFDISKSYRFRVCCVPLLMYKVHYPHYARLYYNVQVYFSFNGFNCDLSILRDIKEVLGG